MENKTTNVEELFYKLKDYGDTRLDLFKLKSINKVSGFLSSLITSVVLMVLLFLVILCITIGAALLLGSLTGSAYYGFFIMAGIYIIIGLVLFYNKDKAIKTPISNKLIKDLVD
ncbi:MAG: phage holin family protein [Ginsengibacter sp.]